MSIDQGTDERRSRVLPIWPWGGAASTTAAAPRHRSLRDGARRGARGERVMGDSAAFVLVDDEKTVLDSLKHELRRGFGPTYIFETAESVQEAWEVIEELNDAGISIVVVVSDWLMPGTCGDTFLIGLKARFPSVIRIMLTGHASEDALRRARAVADVHEVITKPWDSDDLCRVIASRLPR